MTQDIKVQRVDYTHLLIKIVCRIAFSFAISCLKDVFRLIPLYLSLLTAFFIVVAAKSTSSSVVKRPTDKRNEL